MKTDNAGTGKCRRGASNMDVDLRRLSEPIKKLSKFLVLLIVFFAFPFVPRKRYLIYQERNRVSRYLKNRMTNFWERSILKYNSIFGRKPERNKEDKNMEALKAVILAAGKGTRMQSDLPKVVHTIDGKCLVDYVIEAAEGAGAEDICLVVGYKHEEVENTISHKDDVTFVLQEQQLGTGHAVKCAKDFLGKEGHTLILFGDAPLITSVTLKQLLEHHIQHKNAVTVLSATIDDPTGYGRIIRSASGEFIKSVEHKDANEEELKSHEINSGMYVFNTWELSQALDKIQPNNAQGEYYLPDTLTILKNKGLRVDAYALESPEDINGVNDQKQLESATEIIRRRKKECTL